MVPDRTEHVCDVMVVQPVEGAPSVTPNGHEASLPEQAQLMRGSAGRETRRLDEFINSALAVQHRPEQAQPAAGPERSHALGERIGLLDG